jgi:hypothetical protein
MSNSLSGWYLDRERVTLFVPLNNTSTRMVVIVCLEELLFGDNPSNILEETGMFRQILGVTRKLQTHKRCFSSSIPPPPPPPSYDDAWANGYFLGAVVGALAHSLLSKKSKR